MPIQLDLPAELEQRLRHEAERQGVSSAAVTVQLLERHLPPTGRQAKVDAWLRQFVSELDAMSEQEFAVNREVLRAIDDERPAHAKLFTEVLKDAK